MTFTGASGLDVNPGDGTFKIEMAAGLLRTLYDAIKDRDVVKLTIEPDYLNRGGPCLIITMDHSAQRDGDWTTTHLMTQKGIVEL